MTSNNLRVLYMHRPDTGVVTTNITYLVGSRDEDRGETGVAHMLEHMLFKPTTTDVKNGIKAGSAMYLSQTTGTVINANTWKDRTTYYFSSSLDNFAEMLRLEADRMENVILTDKELNPERENVLSEHDMYDGQPGFALEVEMRSIGFVSHPYGHETIGYRNDIEDYTAEKLEWFYRNYYRPDNAVLMIIGDLSREEALAAASKEFKAISNPESEVPRYEVREPAQQGMRRALVNRPGGDSVVGLGFRHAGFPSQEWATALVMVEVLTGGEESILYREFVDTGRVSGLQAGIEPTSEVNMASIHLTLAEKENCLDIEQAVLKAIRSLKLADIQNLVKKAKAQLVTQELFSRTESLHIVQELTECVAAGDLSAYVDMIENIKSVTPKNVLALLQQSFSDKDIIIGHFVGTDK